jgi:hypothetical protein
MIPTTPNGPTTLQGKVYKAATAPYLTPTQKIASVKTLTLSTKAGQKYQNAVVAALEGMQAALQAQKPATPATPATPAAPKKAPEPPPTTLTMPDAGSNTQNSMWNVASKSILDPAPLNNEEKIAEITKILANSSGAAGGKAETYANKLITALGGQATTKTAAVAANPPTPITPTPYGGGGTMGQPAQPKGPPLSFGSEVDTSKYPSWTKAMPKPNSDELTAVKKYTGHYYTEINDKMRSGIGLGGDVKVWAKNLHGFLARASFPEDAVLTRKVSGEYAKKLLGSMQAGMMFVDHGFVSSDNWSGDLTVKIKVKKGSKAAFVDSISSNKGSEKEVIIQNGSHFRVLSYDTAQKHITCELMDENDPDIFL